MTGEEEFIYKISQGLRFVYGSEELLSFNDDTLTKYILNYFSKIKIIVMVGGSLTTFPKWLKINKNSLYQKYKLLIE